MCIHGHASQLSPRTRNILITHATQVIAHAPTFSAAVQKMQRALYEFVIRGVKSNMPFLANVLRHPTFLSGQVRPQPHAGSSQQALLRMQGLTCCVRQAGQIWCACAFPSCAAPACVWPSDQGCPASSGDDAAQRLPPSPRLCPWCGAKSGSQAVKARGAAEGSGAQATTSFIEQHPELFHFNTREASTAAKLLTYLAELVRRPAPWQARASMQAPPRGPGSDARGAAALS